MKPFSPVKRLRSLCLISLIALHGPLCLVFASPKRVVQPPEMEGALAKFFQRHGRDWMVTFSQRPVRVTGLVGSRTEPYTGKPNEMALEFLKENPELFGMKPELDDLIVIAQETRDFGIHVEFQQVLDGLRVENGRIKINFDKRGRLVQVVSSYTPLARPWDRARIERERAREQAISEFLSRTPVYTSKSTAQQKMRGARKTRAELQLVTTSVDEVYFIVRGRAHRAYKVLISAVRPFGIKELIIDASSGAVLQTRDLVSTLVDGEGRVFLPNPVNSLHPISLQDSNDSDEAVPNTSPRAYFTVTLPFLDPQVNGYFSLSGRYVALWDIEPPNIRPIRESNPSFLYLRNSDAFEEVMVYYHLNRIHSYLVELGFTDALTGQLKVDAHGDYGYDNSRYVPVPNTIGEPYIAFGDDGVDDAEDADIIAHEYAHAIQDNQSPGRYAVEGQPKTMSEGFGDYWAFSIYSTETLSSQHNRGCIGEWDRVPYCLRQADRQSYATQYNSSQTAHMNARIWSRILIDLFDELSKEVADRLVLESHFNVPYGPSFAQGADAIIAADWQLYQGAHLANLCRVFNGRYVYRAAGLPDCRYDPGIIDTSRRLSPKRR